MTRTLGVGTDPPYLVHVGAGVLGDVAGEIADASRAALVTDSRVARLHLPALGLEAVPHLVLEPGEGAKSLETLGRVLDFLAGAGLDRRSVVVALGGGVVGDLTGLAASLYMRGIEVVQVPTTLLAMVDASVGGKTAVNLRAGKNLAGTFHHPRAVFADVSTLRTLPEEELASGLGEVVKTALVGDGELLSVLEGRAGALRAGNLEVLEEVVARCVRVKAEVVAGDPLESGARKVLNLGHTFAHGIEHAAGYGRVPHGVAVAVGLQLAVRASEKTGVAEDVGLGARLRELLEGLGLPAGLDGLARKHGVHLDPRAVAEGMRHDKKGAAGHARFVLVRRIGAIVVDRELGPELVLELLAEG